MSLLTNPLQSGLLLQQAVLPYTFTTGELDSLKAKLQAAESQMMSQPNKQAQMLAMSAAEIRTLLRMIDMTYLQGLRYLNKINKKIYISTIMRKNSIAIT